MSPSKTDRRIDATLTGAKQILDISKDLLCLCPIPGLPGAASTLSTLIDMILKVRGNEETRKDLAKKIKDLATIIERTVKQANFVSETDDKARRRLATSPELEKRISTLNSELEDLTNEAEELEEGFFLGFLLSRKNSEALARIRTGIEDATRKFLIEGEIMIELLVNGLVNGQLQEMDEGALKNLPFVNAGYSSALNPTKSGTLQGTRTSLLEELTGWSLRLDPNRNGSFIYVISGGAGTGKSTIAFEMAQRLEDAGALGASFFFVRGAEKFNTTAYVLPTIAYQLARNQPDLYPHIVKAAQEYTRRGKQGEQLQVDLDNLIIKPLMNVHSSHRPITIVLDALDECAGTAQDEVVRLLYLFMQQLPKIPFPIRILVTSRPEMHIQDALDDEDIRKVSKPVKLHEIPRMIVDADIKLFLEARLKVFRCYKDICDSLPSIIEDLTERAAGLFIYADTVVKFLGRNPYHAIGILDALLSDNPSAAAFSLGNLDRLYIAVLQNALDDNCLKIPRMKGYIQVILGSLALLQDYVSTTVLQDLVGIPMRFIRDILGRLGSVILKPETDDVEIRMLHASFPQFLIDNQRCTDHKFYIDASTHHRRLALTCLEMMTTKYPLKRNICNLEDPTIMKSDIRGLHDTVQQYVCPSLQYSCVHWASHLSQCTGPGQDIVDAVIEFTRTKLLVWVEVLSYMDRLEVAVPALLATLSWCETNIRDASKNELLQIIDDTHRLVLQCYTPINECPEHLYISAFSLAPSCLFQDGHYVKFDQIQNSNHPVVKPMTPRDQTWGPCLHIIPVYSVDCRAMLSPDGSLIASGSSHGEVRIWDASIGLSKRTLNGHKKGVQCVAWSPDGQLLASGSADGTIRIWNAISGAQVHVRNVQNRNCKVHAIMWNQDGTQLVTAANPGGVQVWDIVVGKQLNGKITVPGIGTVMAISKDLGHVIDKTATSTLRVWDIRYNNGKVVKELPVRFFIYTAEFLHDDTQVAFCGESDAIYVWDLKSGECTPKVRPESRITLEGRASIIGMAVSKDGNILASSTLNKTHFFNTKTWDLLGSFKGYFLVTASFSANDRRLLTSYTTIIMWDSSAVLAPKPQITLSTASSLPSAMKHDSHIHFVAVSPDGLRVAAVSRETISIWFLQSGSLFCVIQGHFIGSTTFSPDSQKIAVAAPKMTCIWDITTNEPTLVQNISTANDASDRIAWSPDGLWIASAADGSETTRGLGVFNAVTGKLSQHLQLSSKDIIWDVEFSHDNMMLYVRCGQDNAIFIWKEGQKVDRRKHKWETELMRRARLHQDAWILRERDEKKLLWVQQQYPGCLAQWGNYYAVGKASGRLDILQIEESPADILKRT